MNTIRNNTFFISGTSGVWRRSKIAAILLAATFCAAFPLSAHADFVYSDFSSIDGLTLVGMAAQSGNKLRVTPAANTQVGAAWQTAKQSVQEGFQTTFQFRISDPDMGFNGADGFAFVVQNDRVDAMGPPLAPGYGGLFETDPESGIFNSVAIEFDTFWNPERGDPNGNHVSVQTRGTQANNVNHKYSLGCATPSFNLEDGNIHTALIGYVPGSLSISLDGTPLLSVNLDLGSKLNLDQGHAWVGFTAGTGGGYENIDIHNWSLTSVPEPSNVSSLALLSVIGMAAALLRRNARRTGDSHQI